MSSERTYEEDLVGLELVRAELVRQAMGVAEGLERRRLVGRTVVVKIRYEDFTTITRSHSLAQPTDCGDRLSTIGLELLDRTEAATRPVRLVGIGVSNLAHSEAADGSAVPARPAAY